MNDHYTITIKDDKGTKKYSVHRFVKHAIFYASIFLGSILIVGFGSILYLTLTIDKIEKNREGLKNAYYLLVKKQNKLNSNLHEIQSKLEKKEEILDTTQEILVTTQKILIESEEKLDKTQNILKEKKLTLDELSNSLREIETLIGLSPEDNSTIEKRVNITKINSEHRATILQLIPNGSPIVYSGITSKYGYRIHPVHRRKEFHNGTDLKAKMFTPVYATADGMVEWSGFHKKSGYGNLVILQHSYGFKSTFGHLKKVVVKSKQFVKKGELIAYTGNSGLSSGPHLHYEIRYFYQTVNPYWFIKWTNQNYTEIFQKSKKIPWKSIVKATEHIKVPNPTKTVPLTYKQEKAKQKEEGK